MTQHLFDLAVQVCTYLPRLLFFSFISKAVSSVRHTDSIAFLFDLHFLIWIFTDPVILEWRPDSCDFPWSLPSHSRTRMALGCCCGDGSRSCAEHRFTWTFACGPASKAELPSCHMKIACHACKTPHRILWTAFSYDTTLFVPRLLVPRPLSHLKRVNRTEKSVGTGLNSSVFQSVSRCWQSLIRSTIICIVWHPKVCYVEFIEAATGPYSESTGPRPISLRFILILSS
jgi:hypothetical protein